MRAIQMKTIVAVKCLYCFTVQITPLFLNIGTFLVMYLPTIHPCHDAITESFQANAWIVL